MIEKEYQKDLKLYEKEKKWRNVRKSYMKSTEIACRSTLREFILKIIEDETKLICQEHNPPSFQMTKATQEEM